MRLNESAWANAFAVLMGLVYVVCALLVSILPGISKAVAESWFHGVDLSLIWTGGARPNFIIGLVSSVGLSWIAGWTFALVYNRFTK